jgi:imipenem/basic amino acid-specific outer membrane pore
VLTVGAVAPDFASAESDGPVPNGFLADSSLELLLRNYYFNQNGTRGARDKKDWTEGFLATYKSGFTQGVVGFGADVFGYWGVKLDGGAGTPRSGNLPQGRDGRPVDEYGHSGGVLKAKVSQTTLKWGNLQPTAPVFAAGGSRLFPQTAIGFDLVSHEVENLEVEVGHFTAGTGPTTTSSNGELFAYYANRVTPSVDFAGGRYKINDRLSASLYGSRFEDMWHQYYADLSYRQPLAPGQSLAAGLNAYRTLDQGAAVAGDINNTAWSLYSAYSFLTAHTVTLAYQSIRGDTPFDYVAFGDNGPGAYGDSILLANSVQYSDFNAPGEKSWQARYDLKMDSYGVPGLSLMVRYLNGQDIDGSGMPLDSPYRIYRYGSNDKERETDVEVKYAKSVGPVNVLMKLRQAWHRGTNERDRVDRTEMRLILDYPLKFL